MRTPLPVLGVVAALAACAGQPVHPRDTTHEVEAVGHTFVSLFNQCRIDELVTLFQAEARFVSPGSPDIISGREGIHRYLSRPCGWVPPARAAMRDVTALRQGSLAVLSGRLELAQPPDAKPRLRLPLRITLVLQHDGGHWRVTRYHASEGA